MKIFSIFILFSFTYLTTAQSSLDLSYYLPADIGYDENITKPQEILGYTPGEWHVTHDLLVSYMKKLAEESPRITIENRGTTYEGRPLILLTITSPQNHNNLEKIRETHLELTEKNGKDLNTAQMPIVVNQGFSIHGNEASGSNAALLAVYYLAAAQGPEIEETLNNTIILFDPSFNPDGLQRFASWVNTNKNKNLTSNPQDREYSETWPGGRTNHYWFDMNRDWLPVQLPESRGRFATYHKWHPNILTDHHEMGSNSTFFFQPGIPSRTRPLNPKENQELTKEIGTYHAAAFDKLGSFYYTEEDFDDFYCGKGSTFPDINGSIGILFEQGSSRGHVQETDHGMLTFPFTIRNQFTAALSTLKAAKNMREKLLNYQRDFYKNAAKWFKRHDFMKLDFLENNVKAKNVSFEEANDFKGAQGIGGAIFEAKQDRSHPINFGYKDNKIALFRDTTIFIKADSISFNNPIQYTENPLLSGYISDPNLKLLSSTVPFKKADMGRGNVILFTDNTNFRAFWFGTNKLLMNAIFFGDEI